MNNKAWHHFLLIAVAVIVIGLSGFLITKSLGFNDRFGMSETTRNDELPPTETKLAQVAQQLVELRNDWKIPSKGDAPKPTPLFVSIPIVEADGRLYDMLDPKSDSLRPPVTNAWLLSNNLDYLNSGVLAQDPDADGFDSLAEWEAKTDPRDPAVHPPYADKLVFVERLSKVYKLKYSAQLDAERSQITRMPTPLFPKQEIYYLKIGETSGDGNFRLDSLEKKTARNSVGIEVDASVLKITYLPLGSQHDLVMKEELPIPEYYAHLQFLLDGSFDERVKMGDTFSLVKDPETKYRVTAVTDSSVTITYQTGTQPEQTVEINKN